MTHGEQIAFDQGAKAARLGLPYGSNPQCEPALKLAWSTGHNAARVTMSQLDLKPPIQGVTMSDEIISLVGPGKVRVSRIGIALFNRRWPGSTLRDSRAYWFEFDTGHSFDLVDTDTPEQDDGPAAAALADDCKAWLQDGTTPEWLPA